ncbi:hypothetical protein FGO68_gene8432 [Halteria grandinella]|uniref:J domain-containing protein n=1 Tax=Halteria grandinella TaxID=5974 RepID=A0A8J8P5N8_HALGN|nr:hypothetical protein FGO68_gene8432 [Halteria grandinella]
MSLSLLEDLKTYTLWSHPFIDQENLSLADENASRFKSESIKYSLSETPLDQLDQIVKEEIAYLDKLLSSLVGDFKAQINTLIKLHEQESKDLQRLFAYQKRGEIPNSQAHQILQLRNFHKMELEELKMRQLNVIQFLKGSQQGIKECLEEFQNGSNKQMCIEKCQMCQRVIRITNNQQKDEQPDSMRATYRKKRRSAQPLKQTVRESRTQLLQKEVQVLFKNHQSIMEEVKKQQNSQRSIDHHAQSGQRLDKSENERLSQNASTQGILNQHQYMRKVRAQKTMRIEKAQEDSFTSFQRNSVGKLGLQEQDGYKLPLIPKHQNSVESPEKFETKEDQFQSEEVRSKSQDQKKSGRKQGGEGAMPNLQKIIQDLGKDVEEEFVYRRQPRDLDRDHLKQPNCQAHRIRKVAPASLTKQKILGSTTRQAQYNPREEFEGQRTSDIGNKEQISKAKINGNSFKDKETRQEQTNSLHEESFKKNVEDPRVRHSIPTEQHLEVSAEENEAPQKEQSQSHENLRPLGSRGSQMNPQSTKVQHNYMQNNSSAQGRARSTLRGASGSGLHKATEKKLEGIQNNGKFDYARKAQEVRYPETVKKEGSNLPQVQKEEEKQPYFKPLNQFNYFKNNDLSHMEPQKPINLPDIKLTKQQQKSNIEQSMKQQSVWSSNPTSQNAPMGQSTVTKENSRIPNPTQPPQYQFNYFSDRTKQDEQQYFNKMGTQENFYQHAPNSNFGAQGQAKSQFREPSSSGVPRKSAQSRENVNDEPNFRNTQAQKVNEHAKMTNASKYTNIKEEKAKVSKLLEEFERKQRLEKELRMQQKLASLDDHAVLRQGGAGTEKTFESQTPEQLEYVRLLLSIKPWLACLPLRSSKLEYLKKTFPLSEEFSSQVMSLTGKDLEDYKLELQYINIEVVQKRNLLREKKSDYELLMDARYFNKYGDYLYKRLEQKNYYQRLEIPKDATKADIKKSYFKLALIWHPDNIRKKQRFGFAHEQNFTKLVAEIFVLFEDAYKTLSQEESRITYDMKIGR